MGFKLDDHYEKDYFTVEELAKQWDCTAKDIDYLINETGELRLGMKVDESFDVNFIQICADDDINELVKYIERKFNDDLQKKRHFVPRLFIRCGSGIAQKIYNMLPAAPTQTEVFDEEPKYVYEDMLYQVQINDNVDKMGKFAPSYISVLGLHGQRYLLGNVHLDAVVFSRLYKVDFRIITREERDRFVNEHSVNIETSTTPTTVGGDITSKYLSELQIRINHLEKKFPQWKASQKIVQNAGNLQDWIKAETGSDTREVEMIKKALIEIFPELKKR